MQTKSPFRAVNLLFLVVLCLQASNLLFFWLPQYVRLILNEALFVFLPALLYLRLTRQPVRERVRWHWPGWKIAVLSLLIGMGIYPFSAASAGVIQLLLGYTSFAAPADAIPTTVLMSALAVLAYAGMAPLCEEFLFRGVLQPVYETRGAKFAVLAVGLLFILFHLSLLQGLSIVILSLLLGTVNARTRSLPASTLTHFGANFLAALVITQGVFKTGIEKWIVSTPVLIGGVVVALAGLVGLFRLTRPAGSPVPAGEASPAPGPLRKGWLAQGWPLLAAGLLYLPLVGAEFIYSRPPVQAVDPLRVSAAPWVEPQQWRYEIRNVADAVVGEGECRLEKDGAIMQITCSSEVIAYEVKPNNSSTFASSGGTRTDQTRWQAADGRLLSGSTRLDLLDGTYQSNSSWTVGPGGIDIRRAENGKETTYSLPFSQTPLAKNTDLLLAPDYTWPWQLAGIRLEQGENGSVVRFNPYAWRNKTRDSGPLAEARPVSVQAKEEVTTPAGSFTAWKMMEGQDEIAWVDASGSYTVVKFFNGVETWSLK